MPDLPDLPHVVKLAGVTVRFGPLVPGERPDCDRDVPAEATLAAVGGHDGRMAWLIYAVRTGVEAGVIQPHHLAAIELACGAEPLEARTGDPYLTDDLRPHLTSEAAARAVAWALAHDPAASGTWLGVWVVEHLRDHREAVRASRSAGPLG